MFRNGIFIIVCFKKIKKYPISIIGGITIQTLAVPGKTARIA